MHPYVIFWLLCGLIASIIVIRDSGIMKVEDVFWSMVFMIGGPIFLIMTIQSKWGNAIIWRKK